MTAPAFTPGPWHIVGREEEYNLAVCAPRPGNEDRLDSVLGDANAEANARLIAAAPDYDAAADAAIVAIEGLTGTVPEDQMDALMAAYRLLRCARHKGGCDVRPSARAKARGETP